MLAQRTTILYNLNMMKTKIVNDHTGNTPSLLRCKKLLVIHRAHHDDSLKKKKLKQVDSLGVSNPVLLTVHKIRNMHYAINK